MPSDARSTRDAIGLALLVLGAAAAAVAFAVLHWYSVDASADSAGSGFTFADLHHNADQLGAPVAAAFFDRLAWGLVGLVVVFGVAGRLPTPLAPLLRVLGFLAGATGVTLTYYALAQLFDAQRAAGGSSHGVLHNASVGLWLAFAGYAVSAVGAVIASRNPHPLATHTR